MNNKTVGGKYPDIFITENVPNSDGALFELIKAYDRGLMMPNSFKKIETTEKLVTTMKGWLETQDDDKAIEELKKGYYSYTNSVGKWNNDAKRKALESLLGIKKQGTPLEPVSEPDKVEVPDYSMPIGPAPPIPTEEPIIIEAPEVIESTPASDTTDSTGLLGMLTGTSTSSSGTKEAVTMNIKLVIDETKEYGDVLKMLDPEINTKDSVSELLLEQKPIINRSNMVPVINGEIQKYLINNNTTEVARFTGALNKITLDPSKVDKFAQYVEGKFPTAAQLNQEIENLKGTPLFNSKYEVLQADAKISIKDNHPDNWWYTLSENAARNGALYRELRSEKSKTNVAIKKTSEAFNTAAMKTSEGAKVLAAKASIAASAAKENLKQQYQQLKDINSADNLKIKANTAITEFLNGTGSNLPESFKTELVKLQSSITTGSDYLVGGRILLSVPEINQGGPLNKLRKLSTNLKVIKLNNKSLPMWKYGGIYAWNSPYDFMKDLLNADRNALNKFGGKRTRKNKKARTQKAGRRNKKTRRY